MKTCKVCLKEKPESDFPTYVAKGIRGIRGQCRECWNAKWTPVVVAHNKRYYHENVNGYRDKTKLRTHIAHHSPGANGQHSQRNKRYAFNHPDRAKAKVAVMMAVRSGRLTPLLCFCGEKGQAHHDDYSKPLDVKWLCPVHHGERHRLLNRYGADTSKWPEDLRVREWPV